MSIAKRMYSISLILTILMIVIRENKKIAIALLSIQILVNIIIFFLNKVIYSETLIINGIFSLNEAYYIPDYTEIVNANSIRVLGGSIYNYEILLLILYICIFKKKLLCKVFKLSKYSIIKKYIVLKILAVIVGILMIIIGANKILTHPEFITIYYREFYNKIYSSISVLIITLFFLKNKKFIEYNKFIFKILSIQLLLIIVSILCFRDVVWAGSKTLIIPISVIYYPIILNMTYNEKKNFFKKFSLYIGLGILCIYPFASKLYIFLLISILMIIIKKIKNKRILDILIITIIIYLGIFFYLKNGKKLNVLTWKVEQVIKFLYIKEGYIENSSSTMKFRIFELINITKEYLRNKIFIFLGKGFMGTYQDYNNILKYSVELKDVKHSSSLWEWKNCLYYTAHSTVLVLYLQNGLLGILYIIILIKKLIINLFKNPYLVFGILYLLLFTSYSIELMLEGSLFLLGGLKYNSEITREWRKR